MAKVPVLDAGENTVHVNELVENCVDVSKDDWEMCIRDRPRLMKSKMLLLR